MLYERKSFTVPVQTSTAHPKAADLDAIWAKKKLEDEAKKKEVNDE